MQEDVQHKDCDLRAIFHTLCSSYYEELFFCFSLFRCSEKCSGALTLNSLETETGKNILFCSTNNIPWEKCPSI